MLIASYGTLRTDAENHHIMKLADGVSKGMGTLKNVFMFDLGAYPAVSLSAYEGDERQPQDVVVELFEIPDDKVKVLDRFEGYNPDKKSGHLFIRSLVEVDVAGEENVFAYVYHKEDLDFSNYDVVEGGDWLLTR